MKNLYLFPTEKPTRLFTCDSELRLSGYPTTIFKTGKNLHIINNDKIKEGDWYLDTFNGQMIKANEFADHKSFLNGCKKIILTTDVVLIKDGVQAIDDEFLEWFVENPSCKYIYTNKIESFDFKKDKYVYNYKIKISKELTKKDRNCNHNCSVVCGECQILK